MLHPCCSQAKKACWRKVPTAFRHYVFDVLLAARFFTRIPRNCRFLPQYISSVFLTFPASWITLMPHEGTRWSHS